MRKHHVFDFHPVNDLQMTACSKQQLYVKNNTVLSIVLRGVFCDNVRNRPLPRMQPSLDEKSRDIKLKFMLNRAAHRNLYYS
jgi:hypothetical protein